MLLAIVTLLAATEASRPFADERRLLDRRLETLRRILPDGPMPSADAALLRQLADNARLAKPQVQARAPSESAGRGEVVLEVSALAGFEEVDRFFRDVENSHRLVDVKSLTLTATTGDVLQLATVLRLPYWPRSSPLPPPPEFPKGRLAGASRAARDAFLRDQALAYAKSDAIAEWRRARRSPRLFLSELAAAVRERPVALAFASLDEEFTIRGLGLGEGPLRALESRLERGFFRMSEFLIARQGVCQRFEAHGRSPSAGPDAQLPIPTEDPFELDASACRPERDATTRSIEVKGRPATAKNPGSGPLTLRLQDVDLADVFYALSVLGFGGYVVDDAVVGRVQLDLRRATLDETLTAIRKAANVELNEVGPLRRVSLTRETPSRAVPAGGMLASFSLKRGEVRDLLAAMADVDPAFASLGPSGFLGRVSVWTKNAPLAALRVAVLDAAGLDERIEDERRIVARRNGAGETATPVAPSSAPSRLALRREELTVREFELAGIGSSGGRSLAFAYSPGGELFAYAPGRSALRRRRALGRDRRGRARHGGWSAAPADSLARQVGSLARRGSRRVHCRQRDAHKKTRETELPGHVIRGILAQRATGRASSSRQILVGLSARAKSGGLPSASISTLLEAVRDATGHAPCAPKRRVPQRPFPPLHLLSDGGGRVL